MAKSYAELEKKNSTPAKDDKGTPPPKEEKPAEAPKDNPAEDAAFKPYFEEFAKDGKLSDESFKALEAKGISKSMVDQFIAGQQANEAAADAEVSKVLESVGGQDAYKSMIEWAGTNIPLSEIQAYDKAVTSGDPAAARLAVAGLHAQFVKAEGSPANLLRGGPAAGVKAFDSTAQVTAAMRDPRYKSDPAYRQEVMDRIAVSNVL